MDRGERKEASLTKKSCISQPTKCCVSVDTQHFGRRSHALFQNMFAIFDLKNFPHCSVSLNILKHLTKVLKVCLYLSHSVRGVSRDVALGDGDVAGSAVWRTPGAAVGNANASTAGKQGNVTLGQWQPTPPEGFSWTTGCMCFHSVQAR